jgi:hypothetical protein
VELAGPTLWLVKSFAKKFQLASLFGVSLLSALYYPLIEYIATRLQESYPSLRNLRPNPGARVGVRLLSVAEDILIRP